MIATLALMLTLGGANPDQQPAPGGRSAPPSGTAVISGRVISADAEPKPVRRARVTLNSSDREVGRTVISDDAGAFSFTALPAGRYSLSAIKAGFVTVSYGEKRPGRPGTAIPLNDAQRVTGLTLRMHRGAVITGTIVAPSGEPARGVAVSALRYSYSFSNGERRLGNAGTSSETDDRGAYRVYGLAAGEYVVAATTRTMSMFSTQREDIRVMTDAEVRAALAMLSAGGGGGATGGVVAGGARSAGPPPTVGYAPVFYPGTTTASQAGTISVGIAEERIGVDFQLQFVPTAKVEGLVLLPDGTPLKTGTVTMVGVGQASVPGYSFDAFRTARPDAEGRFTFTGVTPGPYVILSRGAVAGTAAPPGPDGMRPTPPLWATADVAVEGQNVSGVTLLLQPGMTVSGKIVFEGTTLPPPPLNRLRVNLAAAQSEVNLGTSAATVDASGQFTITGVTPGRYRLTATVAGARPDTPGWTLKSSTIAGQETLDVPFTLGHSAGDAVVTLTDAPPELSGTVQDSSGQPAPDYSVVVFSADRQHWTPQSRRIQSVRPSAAGKYIVRNLPAGDYLIAAVIDVEPNEWFDPNYLQQLAGSSFKITVGDGEKKVQDVAVSRQ